MKTKYKLITMNTISDKHFTDYLQKQAKNGWMLEKTGSSFFKFRKTEPQDLRFFIDYERPIHSYLQVLEQRGYHFIDNFRIINIFYSDDINKEPIEKDAALLAAREKRLYHPGIIATFIISGLLLFFTCDIFGLSTYLFISKDHMILYFNKLIAYFILKFVSVFFIWQGIFLWLLRFKCSRESHNKQFPHGLFVGAAFISRLFDIIIFITLIVCIIIFSMDLPFLLLAFFLYLILYCGISYCINKKIIKIENETKRKLLMIVVLLFFIISYLTISSVFDRDEQCFPQSNGYQSAANNYESQSRTLLYNHETYYGHDNDKDQLNSYIQTYSEDIYYCINEDIAQSVFAALIINADHDRRIPDMQEIDRITEEKGSFDSLKDVPFYNYEKSAAHLNAYHDQDYDLCYGYDDNYIVMKDKTVFSLQLKDDTDLHQLLDYYFNK